MVARHCPPVRAAIDISDGLLLDLATLLQASGGLGAEIDEATLRWRPRRAGRRVAT